jgi:hypothetical protein
VGDLLLAIWLEIDAATTGGAAMDVGTFTGGINSIGLFWKGSAGTVGHAVDVHLASSVMADLTFNAGIFGGSTSDGNFPFLQTADIAYIADQAGSAAGGYWSNSFGPPFRFSAANPLKAIISGSGAWNGSAVTASGSGVIHIATVTPA